MASAWGLSWGGAWGDSWGTILDGLDITNDNAVTIDPSYEICMRSGKKVKRNTLVQEWTNLWVRPESLDRRNEQDWVKLKAERLEGSIRPEAEDTFITDEITIDDL